MPESNIHKLISLTFDENPRVRKEAAKSLSEIDDPAALFALMELSYDKDLSVKKMAREILNKKKLQEQEVFSFAEIFSARQKEQFVSEPENQEEKRKRILLPIEQLFEKKLGKQKADAVKGKMMPTIEKIYSRVINVKPSNAANTGRTAIQEFLTSYLEAISDIDALNSQNEQVETQKVLPTIEVEKEVELPHHEFKERANVQETLDTIGSKHGSERQAVEEIRELEASEFSEDTSDPVSKLPPTFLKRAYETMMLTGGDEELMKKEMRRTMKDIERDLKLAFHAAKKKFKETDLTHITKLKEGMGLVNTDFLEVKSIESLTYSKRNNEVHFYRVVVNDDEGNEGVVYLMDKNGDWIKPGMKIKIIKGRVKSFDFSGETAISVGKKGNVYIVL